MNMKKQGHLHCESCLREVLAVIRTRRVTRTFKKVPFEIEEPFASCQRCGTDVYHEDSANITMARLVESYRQHMEGDETV